MRERTKNERLKNGTDAKPCLSDVYKSGTRARRRQADAALCGRSMVEMLGVLAIIGVLSVGAISGYSKAMLKYKLNKQAEAMNLLLNNAMQLRPPMPDEGNTFYSELLSKLNLLPDGIVLHPSDTTYLRDMFNNGIWFYAQYPKSYGLGYRFDTGGDRKEICRNLINVYKAYADELHFITTDWHYTSEDTGEEGSENFGRYYGNGYCTDGRQCIKDITLNDIDTLCNHCAENATECRFYASWY